MTWFALDCNIWTNPKIIDLSELLKIDIETAICRIARIWSWAMLSGNEDGNIGNIPDDELASIARWKKKPAVFVEALISCGLIDVTEDGKILHDWQEVNGSFLAKKRKDRERKIDGDSTEVPRKFHGKSRATVPNHTVPNQTIKTIVTDTGEAQASETPAPPPKITVQDILAECALSPALDEAAQKWLAYKSERREAYKPTGLRALLAQIISSAAKHGESAVVEVIAESMSSGYKGITFDRLKAPLDKPLPKSHMTPRKQPGQRERDIVKRNMRYLADDKEGT